MKSSIFARLYSPNILKGLIRNGALGVFGLAATVSHADVLVSPGGTALIELQNPPAMVQTVGARVKLDGKIVIKKGDDEGGDSSAQRFKVRAYFPDRTTEVTNQIGLDPSRLTFSYLTPPLESSNANTLLIEVGESSHSVAKMQLIQAKLEKRLAYLRKLLIDLESRHAKKSETQVVQEITATIEKLSAKILRWVGSNSAVIAQRAYPLKVANLPSASSFYLSVFNHYKISIAFNNGAVVEGESLNGSASVTNVDGKRSANGKGKGPEKKDPVSIDFNWNGNTLHQFASAPLAEGETVSYDLVTGKVFSSDLNRFEVVVKDKKGSNGKQVAALALNAVVVSDSVSPVWSSESSLLKQSPFSKESLPVNASISDALGKVDPLSLQALLSGTKDTGGSVALDVRSLLQISSSDNGFSYNVEGNVNPLAEGAYQLSLSAKDLKGNTALPNPLQAQFRIDRTPPSLATALSGPVLTHQKNLAFKVTVSDRSPTKTKVSLNGGTVLENNAQTEIDVATVLSEGVNTIEISSTDAAGNEAQPVQIQNIVLDTNPPVLSNLIPANGATLDSLAIPVSGRSNKPLMRVSANGGLLSLSDDKLSFSGTVSVPDAGSHRIRWEATDLAGNTSASEVSISVSLIVIGDLPPDPKTVAPPLNPTASTTLKDSVSFLYTGEDPIQTGVTIGAIEEKRVAVVIGRVLDRDGAVLPGVRVSILGHPELGETKSRADGRFDLAANGGGFLTVAYEKDGFLTAHRQVKTPWRDYASVPDVALIPLDTRSTVVDLSGSATTNQVHRASIVTDSDGPRQAILVIPPGTTANLILPNGSSMPASPSLTIRASEYTVGPNGPKAMPASLPPQSAYTYAIELSADEALGLGAREVTFSQPLSFYVDNFLNFPVGGGVPVGFYDRMKAQWVPSKNGRIISVLGMNAGVADLDVRGSGQVATAQELLDLGITLEERATIGGIYQVGKSFWRVSTSHFTPFDLNWSIFLDPTVTFPNSTPVVDPLLDEPSLACHQSTIQLENRVFNEEIDVPGTEFSLNYSSDRSPGYIAGKTMRIPVTPSTVSSTLDHVEVEVLISGKRVLQTFPPAPNQSYNFIWDGKDGYGRDVNGGVVGRVKVTYFYPAVYTVVPASVQSSFGQFPAGASLGRNSRGFIELASSYEAILGEMSHRELAIGGWSLNQHHFYDPEGQSLYLGDGRRVRAVDQARTIKTFAGNGNYTDPVSGSIATSTSVIQPLDVSVSPDGKVYFTTRKRLAYVDLMGKLRIPSAIPDIISDYPYNVLSVDAITYGSDSAVYFSAMSFSSKIHRLNPDGTLTWIAGNGFLGVGMDNLPATQSSIFATSIAAGSDGSLYISDQRVGGETIIRQVGTDGIIRAIAGRGTKPPADGVLASETKIYPATAIGTPISLAPDGTLYFATSTAIYQIRVDGRLRKVAGEGVILFGNGDGGLATNAVVLYTNGLAFGPDGSLYLSERDSAQYARFNRIRQITPDGTIRTVTGAGSAGFAGDNGPAPRGKLYSPAGLSVSPDGVLYIADEGNSRIRAVTRIFPVNDQNQYVIASRDKPEVYTFDKNGRHLETRDSKKGILIYAFTYDGSGNLASITDRDGKITTIERNGAGEATRIISPFGKATNVTVGADGYLRSVTHPDGAIHQMTYSANPGATGLLTSLRKPKGNVSQFAYDASGKLTLDQNAAGGGIALTESELLNGILVGSESALGRSESFRVENLGTGTLSRLNTDKAGLQTSILKTPSEITTTTRSDGTVITEERSGDPRLGMQASFPSLETVRAPSGLTLNLIRNRTATLASPLNVYSLTNETETVSLNGKTTTTSLNGTTLTRTITSPQGRVSTITYDAKGRVIKEQFPGATAIQHSYNSLGQLSQTTQGPRVTQFAYNPSGFLSEILAPLTSLTRLGYDGAGRTTSQELPDGGVIQYSYDLNGNLTGVTPPGKPNHSFTFNLVDLLESFLPPSLGFNSTTTRVYNLDKDLKQYSRADNGQVKFIYSGDASGQPNTGELIEIQAPSGNTGFTYQSNSRNLASTTSPDGVSINFTYDGPLLTGTQYTGGVSGSVAQTYNNDFRVSAQSINGGSSVAYTYDNDGLLTVAGSEMISRNTATGQIEAITLGGTTETKLYNAFSEVSSIQGNAYAEILLYDNLGRISQKEETSSSGNHTYNYGYDPGGRLKTVSKDSVLEKTYNYDSNGNRTSVVGSATTTGTYDDQDRLTSYGSLTFTYSNDGELTRKTDTSTSETTQYVTDALGNLKSVLLPSGTQIDYLTDGLNRRVAKKVNGTTTQKFLYQDQLKVVAELDASNALVSRFVYASKSNIPDYMIKFGTTYRVFSDHLGSPRAVVNVANGSVAQAIEYDEFGNVTLDTNPGFVPFGFAGCLYDHDTKLCRFGAREYDAGVGRWLSKDPILFAGGDTNLYGYVLSDPINLIDPSGLAYTSSTDGTEYSPSGADDVITGTISPIDIAVGATAYSAAGAAMTSMTAASQATWASVFRPGGFLNSGQNLRMGYRNYDGRNVFRIAGDWVPRSIWKDGHIVLKDYGPAAGRAPVCKP